MRILISGANGFLGTALVPHLEKAGHTVVRLVRQKTSQTDIVWDPSRDQLDASLIGGFDLVIHLAGANIATRRWTKLYKREIWDSRIKSTNLLARRITESSQCPKLFISMSGVGYYGSCGDTQLAESSPQGHDFMAELAVAWENATQPLGGQARVVNLRTSMVLSADGGALNKMLPAFKLGLGGRLGSGHQYWSWITLDDFRAAIDFIIAHDNLSGPINMVSPEPVTNGEFTSALAKALHRPAVLPAPAFALRLAFGEMADAVFFASQRVLPFVLIEHGFTFRHSTLSKALASVVSH